MSEADRVKWNQRYRTMGDEPLAPPSALLVNHIGIAPAGLALDIACGRGRNALYMARQGFAVEAMDIAQVGLDIGCRAAEKAARSAMACLISEHQFEVAQRCIAAHRTRRPHRGRSLSRKPL